MRLCFRYLAILILGNAPLSSFGQDSIYNPKSLNLSSWAFKSLNIPALSTPEGEAIVVAVIDDGFRFSHNSLKGYIYTNDNEIPGNIIDDDQNGYIDDYRGWDVSDNDGDVQITKSNESTYYHGTFISSLIARIFDESFGSQGNEKLKILPIKVLSDHAEVTAIRDGYLGIEYAMKMGADIICCAWSGGNPTKEEIEIINKALQRNILIIGSAGNTNQEKIDFPASMSGIIAIASLDSMLRKTHDSNYGMGIDLAFPGENVRAAFPVADNAWFYGRGTSAAAGLASGCAALLQAFIPEASPKELIDALKNTAVPIDSINNSYCGKLGPGLPDISNAANYLMMPELRHTFFDSERPEGTIYISSTTKESTWNIRPRGAYHSITVIPEQLNKKDSQKKIYFSAGDSLYYSGPLEQLRGGITIPGSEVIIQFMKGKKKLMPSELKLNYFVETIDSTNLFCGGIINIEADEGFITDNSGNANYTNNCACSWLIHAPESDQIQFSFVDFNTESKVDYVWLFDGFEAHPDNIIAKFSGPDVPPSITSRTNMVKVWFVTDNKKTGRGWKLHFKGQKR